MGDAVLSFSLLSFSLQATGMALAQYLQNAMYGISGETLTYKLRQLLFRAILRQEIGWFDRTDNSTGALATKLSNDASAVQGMTGANLGLIASGISTLATGMGIAFAASWQLTLVVLGTLPLVRPCARHRAWTRLPQG
jgi:ATP-binding cassette, subfamily B (MDR/TAP), member 1